MSFTNMDSKEANLESAPAYSGEQPPSYESIFGKIKHAKETSDGNVGFAKAAMGIMCASVGCTIMLGITMAIPIASIIIGAMYLDDCPLERYIPIYLVVSGAVGLFYNLFGIVKTTCCKKNTEDGAGEEGEEGAASKLGTCLSSLLSCFMTAWFIAGNVWVYGSHSDLSTNSASTNYCHPTAYYFAFWVITACYIIIGLVILLSCCCCVALCCCSKKE